jgi:hypothetical protein
MLLGWRGWLVVWCGVGVGVMVRVNAEKCGEGKDDKLALSEPPPRTNVVRQVEPVAMIVIPSHI